jgi:small subunit ribosomal protein S3
MGQKVHPIGFRLGIIKDWDSVWYAEGKDYAKFLHEDLGIKRHIERRFGSAGIGRIKIERLPGKVNVNIFTAKPGVIIGKKGVEIEALKNELEKITGKKVNVNIIGIKDAAKNARIVAHNIAMQIEQRVPFRRAMKQAIFNAIRAGAKGIKVMVAGRLNGAEIARKEKYIEGRVPLQTIRADIDYGFAIARTKYGVIGVKVWIYNGDVIEPRKSQVKERLLVNKTEDKEE